MQDTLGFRIRVERMRKKVTQADLAKKVGISRNSMNLIELGEVDLRSSHLLKIANVLDVSMDYLTGRTSEN